MACVSLIISLAIFLGFRKYYKSADATEKEKAEGKGVYKTPLKVQVTGATQGSFTQTAPSVGTIESTAQKVKAENILVILEGDKTNTLVQCPAADPSTGATTTIPVTVTVQTAGQTKVMGA